MRMEQWLNGVKPSCVGQDYEGYALTPDHEKKVDPITGLKILMPL